MIKYFLGRDVFIVTCLTILTIALIVNLVFAILIFLGLTLENLR
jgi:hypothetical protein